jgi:hypothetical protein
VPKGYRSGTVPAEWSSSGSSGRYLPGERGWIKMKNREYRRWEIKREGVFKIRRTRQFV